MFERLDEIVAKYDELTGQLGDPEVLAEPSKYMKAAKQHRDLEPVVEKYGEFKRLQDEIVSTRQMLDEGSDAELQALARDELTELESRLATVKEDLKQLLLPKDPNDEKNVLLEIRAGTGGDEASLFAAEILRMYSRYAERQGWRVNLMDVSGSGIGGIKEAVAMIEGKGAYSRMKHESGVHRVQRVPVTEASGRIHTSAITVAVLPEAEEVDVKIDPRDIRIDTFCSSGPGGQSVNTTYSAVRITHVPTGLIVSCQDEKSQIKNREKAMRVLRSRLLEMERERQHEQISAERRHQVKSGDRSEKIRTYNFKENRVTDHRIGLTLHQLNMIMDGDLDGLIDPLLSHYQAQKLRDQSAAA